MTACPRPDAVTGPDAADPTGQVRGFLLRVSDEQILINPASGQPVAFRIDGRTEVRIGAALASPAALTEGTEVSVAFRRVGRDLVAVRVEPINPLPQKGGP